MTTDSLQHLSPVWSHLTTIQPERGEGIYLYTADGTRYADFTSGIGVTNTGHSHPRVVAAIQEQAARLIHGQINVVIAPSTVKLADTLDTVTPPEIDSFFFSNSGAEATEGAVKLARAATKRQNIITFQGSFHGRTAQTMAMTNSKTVYRAGYQPLPGGVFVAPFPYIYRYQREHGWDADTTIDFCLHEFDLLLKTQSAPEETAAVIIEPELGEGGYVPAPARFLEELRERCAHYGILFVADEVQTGFGRTGKFWGFQHADIVPDIMVMAKGLGSGMPISAIGASRDLMSKWPVGSHGGTYGGGALAAAAGVASVETIRDEHLPENAALMGERLRDGLVELQGRYPVIGDVRGHGLMVGTEFIKEGAPAKDLTKAIQKGCLDRKLLLLTCGSYENVIRWIPPLVVNEAQIDDALTVFEDALRAAL
jgi:4-aminobutyrate aminotransferase